jgi:26S proteasome regulatory subunit N2
VLIEEKLKKVTTEKAPVAGATLGDTLASGGRTDAERSDRIAQLLEAAEAGSRRAGAGGLGASARMLGRGGGLEEAIARQMAEAAGVFGPGAGSGAAAAAGVLTAVDEDQEGDEEAPMPDAFDYHTDAEEDE